MCLRCCLYGTLGAYAAVVIRKSEYMLLQVCLNFGMYVLRIICVSDCPTMPDLPGVG